MFKLIGKLTLWILFLCFVFPSVAYAVIILGIVNFIGSAVEGSSMDIRR